MYKILLADNEGIVLDSLIHIINDRFGEACDVRTAKTARYTRSLARKFIPDIAVINVQMPGMRGFEMVREIRSYDMKCVFITVSSYNRTSYQNERRSLNTLTHLTKPLFREKILPVLEEAVSIVEQLQKRSRQTQLMQEKLDTVLPILEHGLIYQLFFPESAAAGIRQYKEFLDIRQDYAKVVALTFEDHAEAEQDDDSGGPHNPIGSFMHLQKEYASFRERILEYFPHAIVGPVMGNHIFFLLPCWNAQETKKETAEFSANLDRLLDALSDAFERLVFHASFAPIKPMSQLSFPHEKEGEWKQPL